jgi:hypothetical protein
MTRSLKKRSESVSEDTNVGKSHSLDDVVTEIEIGGKYMVAWKNGQTHPARVIAQRPSRNEESCEQFEYYVHYLKHDRRLDEWVTSDRIDRHAKSDLLSAHDTKWMLGTSQPFLMITVVWINCSSASTA